MAGPTTSEPAVAKNDQSTNVPWAWTGSDLASALKFSECMSSPMIKIIVGDEKGRIPYHIHKALAVSDSDYIRNALHVPMQESMDGTINLEDMDPHLFGYYVEYLYRDGWLFSESVETESECVVLAQLFALGEYLQSRRFMEAIYAKLTYYTQKYEMTETTHCQLLEVTTNLPELPTMGVGNLRECILLRAIMDLSSLRLFAPFSALLDEYPELAKDLVMTDPHTSIAESDTELIFECPRKSSFSPENILGRCPIKDNNLKPLRLSE